MRLLLLAQAAYYVTTGLSPLISREAFERATGRKRDWWLVQMVGLLAVTVGSSLLVGASARSVTTQTRTLAILSAVSFASIDLVYGLSGRISRIYLFDAALEFAFLGGVLLDSE